MFLRAVDKSADSRHQHRESVSFCSYGFLGSVSRRVIEVKLRDVRGTCFVNQVSYGIRVRVQLEGIERCFRIVQPIPEFPKIYSFSFLEELFVALSVIMRVRPSVTTFRCVAFSRYCADLCP